MVRIVYAMCCVDISAVGYQKSKSRSVALVWSGHSRSTSILVSKAKNTRETEKFWEEFQKISWHIANKFCNTCLAAFTFAPLASSSAKASVCPFFEASIAEVHPSLFQMQSECDWRINYEKVFQSNSWLKEIHSVLPAKQHSHSPR